MLFVTLVFRLFVNFPVRYDEFDNGLTGELDIELTGKFGNELTIERDISCYRCTVNSYQVFVVTYSTFDLVNLTEVDQKSALTSVCIETKRYIHAVVLGVCIDMCDIMQQVPLKELSSMNVCLPLNLVGVHPDNTTGQIE